MGPDELRAHLGTLGVPVEPGAVLGAWPRNADGGLEIHLSAGVFWRLVTRLRPVVSSTVEDALLFPHRHRFIHDGVEFVTFSAEPVLPPGTLTPGFALRLT